MQNYRNPLKNVGHKLHHENFSYEIKINLFDTEDFFGDFKKY